MYVQSDSLPGIFAECRSGVLLGAVAVMLTVIQLIVTCTPSDMYLFSQICSSV